MKNNFSIVNPMLIGERHKNCLNPYKIRDYKEYNYRRISRNKVVLYG